MLINLLRRLRDSKDFCLFAIQAPWAILYFAIKRISWDSTWRLHGMPMVRVARSAKISIGKRFQAASKSQHNSIGVTQPVILTAYGKGSQISIGDDVGMSGCSITAFQRVTIGNRVLVGSGALITDNDAHPIHPDGRRYGKEFLSSPVEIGDDVFVGARAIVLKGVRIGKGAIVGAAAVVSKDVPDYGIAVGNPARVVGDSRGAAFYSKDRKPAASAT